MLSVVIGASSVWVGWLAMAVLAAVAWLAVARVPRKVRVGLIVAVLFAVALAVEGIPVDHCAACRAGLMPEWWCWLNLCW